MLEYLLQNNLFQMNSFYKKKLNRRWTWESPDGRTKNEIDYIITDKKRIVKDVTVLNRFSTGSDHRLVRAKVVIDTDKERHRMLKKKANIPWKRPADIEGFQRSIDNRLASCDAYSNEDINTLNDILTSAVIESQNKYCPKTQKDKKLSQNTRQMIQERRDLRSKGIVANNELKEANKKVAKAIRRDIRAFNTNYIQHTIEENKSMKVMRRKLGIGKKHIFKLKTKQGAITTNREEILKIVEDFYQMLYTSQHNDTLNSGTEPDIVTAKKGIVNQGSEELPCITIDEIKLALRKTKNNKAPGEDNVVADTIKIGGPRLLEKITVLFNLCIYNSTIPDKWHNAIVILLHKKGDIVELENYRPISLLSHLYKLFTKIITARLEKKLDFYQPPEQAGFRAKFGTNDHLQSIKTVIEKSIEYNRPLVLAFVDFQKAFDTVEPKAVLSALQECRVDYRYTKLIYNIYKNAKVTVKLHENTKCIQIGRGVRQGDTISPKLFITVLEYAFKKLNWENKGLNIDGRNLTNLRFADDIVLLADNLKDIKDML